MRAAPRLSIVPDDGLDADATMLANVVVATLERPMEDLWELIITAPGVDGWLGSAGAPAPGIVFASAIAPQFAGTVRSIRADDSSKSMFLDISNRTVRVSLLKASPDTTTVVVEDPNIGFEPATREAWNRVVGEITDCHLATASYRPRQAVVVIHGIGEQRPGKTIEGFIDAILANENASENASDGGSHTANHAAANVTSHPFRDAHGSDTRRYRAAEQLIDGQRRPETDFFEYYWAHHVGGTGLTQVLAWIAGLLLRNPFRMQRSTRSIWLSGWLGLILLLSSIPAYLWIPAVGGTLVILSIGGIILLGLAVGWFLRHFVGDAARYLGSAPPNVSLRQTIRTEGVGLLRRLHMSHDYDRIIVVGHSLGTVVGYDMVRHYWAEVNDTHRSPATPASTALDDYLTAASPLGLEALGLGASDPGSANPDQLRADYQDAQRRLWTEQRQNGNDWLITDFVTLGSPLAHAQLLLSEGDTDFQKRKARLELPTCPPSPGVRTDAQGERTRAIYEDGNYRVSGATASIKLLNKGAPFAPTRWSNLYYKGRFSGDPVGGPLADAFGSGIVDIAVNPGKNPMFWWLLGHPKYARGPALEELLGSLDLFDYDSQAELAAEMPVGYRLRSRQGVKPAS